MTLSWDESDFLLPDLQVVIWVDAHLAQVKYGSSSGVQ